MSGPIVRRYGFPNFEQIFGKRDLEHGVESPETPAETPKEVPAAGEAAAGPKDQAPEKSDRPVSR